MKVLRPSPNKQTGNPKTHGYIAYDFDAEPDLGYRASFYGKVVQAKNSETRNWIANTKTDPYKPTNGTRKLRTEDYGNYIKIKGEVDGAIVYQLGSHFQTNSVLPVGTEVKKGQVVAQSGNTGNSTGTHNHSEYRNSEGTNIEVEFTKDVEETPTMEPRDKKQEVKNIYKGTRGDFGSDDEVNARLQENKSIDVQIEDRLRSDELVKKRWLKEWGIETEDDHTRKISEYQNLVLSIKETLRRVEIKEGADFAEILSKMEWLVTQYIDLKNKQIPKVIYKYQDKDYTSLLHIGNIVIILEGGE